MKKITYLLLIAVMPFISCSSDDEEGEKEEVTVQNQITFEDQSYDANFAIHATHPTRFELMLSDVNYLQMSDYSGKMTFVSMAIYSENGVIVPGTYTFSADTDPDYDPSKHFFDSYAAVGMDVVNGEPDTSVLIENVVSGTVTISENNNVYDIDYSIDYEGGTIEATYTGILIETQI